MENNITSMEKGFVLDTSALMEHPDIVDRVPGAVFIPLTVIKQLDGLKNNSDINVSKQARSASFFIERAIKGKRVAILTKFNRVDGLDNESDNRIVGAAVWLQENNPFADVVLVTTDRNMRIVGNGYGLNSIADQDVKFKKDIPKWRSVLKWIGLVLIVLNIAFLVTVFFSLADMFLTADTIGNLSMLAFVLLFFGFVFYGTGKGDTKRFQGTGDFDVQDQTIAFTLRHEGGPHRWGLM